MMDQLWYAIDRVAPFVHMGVAMLGKVPAGTLSVALLIALWFVAGRIAFFVVTLPGMGAGWMAGAWLYIAHGWHPLLCVSVGLAVSAAIFQVLVNLFYLRLAIAVVVWPLAVLAIWHLAAGALDTLWAIALTWVGAMTVGSLVRRFVNTENFDLYTRVNDLIADIRGE